MASNMTSNFTSGMVLPVLLHDNAYFIERATDGSAGYDIKSSVSVVVPPCELEVVETGIAVAIPHSHYGRLAPRSSISKLRVFLEAGVIDEDYRGTIKVMLYNASNRPFTIEAGDRIAQLIIEAIAYPEPVLCKSLPETTRGSGGFGSTGLKDIKKVEKQSPTIPDKLKMTLQTIANEYPVDWIVEKAIETICEMLKKDADATLLEKGAKRARANIKATASSKLALKPTITKKSVEPAKKKVTIAPNENNNKKNVTSKAKLTTTSKKTAPKSKGPESKIAVSSPKKDTVVGETIPKRTRTATRK